MPCTPGYRNHSWEAVEEALTGEFKVWAQLVGLGTLFNL